MLLNFVKISLIISIYSIQNTFSQYEISSNDLNLLTTKIICGKNQDSQSKIACQQKIKINNVEMATTYTKNLSDKMYFLAIEYYHSYPSLKICDLYLDLKNYLSQAQVKGKFNNYQRLEYRIKWYLDPEINLSPLCFENESAKFVRPIYDYLIEQSYSLKGFKYF